MKFYIISIILNIILLFIPVGLPFIAEKEENHERNIMEINLKQSILEMKPEEGIKAQKPLEGLNRQSSAVHEAEMSQLKEADKLENVKEIAREKEKLPDKPLKEQVNLKQDRKESIPGQTENRNRLSSSPVLTPSSDGGGKPASGITSVSGTDKAADIVGVSQSHKSIGAVNGRSIAGENKSGNTDNKVIEKSTGNVCREGTDFTVSYNPQLQYPVAAQRMGNTGSVVVNVRLNFNSNGSVTVISVSGGSSIFQEEARKAASRIKVRIKNSDTLKCNITKPFRFNPR